MPREKSSLCYLVEMLATLFKIVSASPFDDDLRGVSRK
jgi:hypothetical protein